MMSVFKDAWPATVSEMLEDTEAAHGMVFRSLMVTGGLMAMQADFSKLSPEPPPDNSAVLSFSIGLVHLFRRLVLAGAVGFCFAPTVGNDHTVAGLRETMGATDGDDAEEHTSRRLQGTIWETTRIQNVTSKKRAEVRSWFFSFAHTTTATNPTPCYACRSVVEL
jgi:hypothetical protein